MDAIDLAIHRRRGLGDRRRRYHHHRLRPALPMMLTTTMAMVMGRAVCTSTRTSAVLDG